MKTINSRQQRGVAVITALLLTTLAITIVASLFWQQQVQVRSIENQRMQLQKKWILRGAIDWARLILREDAKSTNVDHLGEPWAVKLADTRLDQYVENAKADNEDSDATLSGQVVDAQGMYNLNNLATDGNVDAREVAVFSRLLVNLHFDWQLAEAVADMVARTQTRAIAAPGSSSAETGAGKSSSDSSQAEVQFLRFTQVDDLLAINGFTPEMMEKLKAFVTVLPGKTSINVNTTFAEVLAARIDGLSMGDAAAMIASRDRAYFLTVADFKSRFEDRLKTLTDKDVDVASKYFIINGKVKMNRSALDVSALIERANNQGSTAITTTVLWVREN